VATADPWPAIHAERQALIADLEPLAEDRWTTPSLCDGWSVRDVLAHMTATAQMTPPKFFAGLIGAGFSFNKMTAKDVARQQGSSPVDTLARFKDQSGATTHPPGPIDAMVGEAVIHSEDIRRPLGISHTVPPEMLIRAADFYKGSNLLIGAKKRIAGLTLRASDTEWTTGTGPEVTGPMLSLVLALTGRTAALDDLSGDGLATLKGRT
jgi:uncharacterized protein (TIGR03083 family)